MWLTLYAKEGVVNECGRQRDTAVGQGGETNDGAYILRALAIEVCYPGSFSQWIEEAKVLSCGAGFHKKQLSPPGTGSITKVHSGPPVAA